VKRPDPAEFETSDLEYIGIYTIYLFTVRFRWPAPRYWTLCLLLLPVATLFGNALVCLSVCTERGLHTATNYFIVSLAIADIMVAILVMPLAVYVEVGTYSLNYGLNGCSSTGTR